jgi:hypothetical protein
MAKYVPQVIVDDEDYTIVSFALKVDKCVICKSLTMAKITHYSYFPFPNRWIGDQEDQMTAAGIRPLGGHTYHPEDGPICNVCAEQGLGRFLCAGCGLERAVSHQKERIGDPPEFLCMTCYETMPAKRWNEIKNELNERHKYDWE